MQTANELQRPDVLSIAKGARAAARILATLPDDVRRNALFIAADLCLERQAEILRANEQDVNAAMRAVESGDLTPSMLERLKTSESGIAEMAAKIRDVAELADPLNRLLSATQLDEGLTLHKITCPLGVVAIVFESRPDVIPQVAALALRSGNAVIFKGGTEATCTNETLVSVWREALTRCAQIPVDSVNLLRTRADVAELLALQEEIDLIIPRGSRQFVSYIAENTRIPVLGHGEGICHVYIDRAANLEQALNISFDSKVQYPAACNAMETLLVHEQIAPEFLPVMIERFVAAGVEVRGCSRTVAFSHDGSLKAAKEADWSTEYSDLVIAIRVVANAGEAIEHIQQFGSGHTESIVTEDKELAHHFLNSIDAAGVFHNASTRFADGFRYGLGAELGISTSKLHARGPVGLGGLTTYKYKLFGNGHIVETYSSGERTFRHCDLELESRPDKLTK
jgi:glutamate-5-semialdehyde dehydrogenase